MISGIPSECQTVSIRTFCRSDLGPDCLQKLSADDTSIGKDLNFFFLFKGNNFMKPLEI